MNAASDPDVAAPAPPLTRVEVSRSFTSDEVSQRRRLYLQTAVLANLISSLTSLSGLSDGQLRAMSVLRWTMTFLLLVLGAWLAGNNALRAAIDRSTAAPGIEKPAP